MHLNKAREERLFPRQQGWEMGLIGGPTRLGGRNATLFRLKSVFSGFFDMKR